MSLLGRNIRDNADNKREITEYEEVVVSNFNSELAMKNNDNEHWTSETQELDTKYYIESIYDIRSTAY